MATIDLTLNGIKIPALDGYTPPFGTKVATGGLTTQEVNDNVIAPFVKERPIEITEDSSTGSVEYNASLVINSADAVLTLGSGTYTGCTVKVIAATAGSVSYNSGTTDTLVAGQIKTYIWTGSAWIDALGETQPKLTAGTGIDITGATISYKSTYPNSEAKTGEYWHDGKPIYAYHVVAGSYSKTGGTNITITTDLTSCNIDTFIKTRGFLIRDIAGALTVYEIGLTFVATDGSYSPLAITPYYSYSTKVHTVQLSGNTNMTFTKGDYYVYYTKTTD